MTGPNGEVLSHEEYYRQWQQASAAQAGGMATGGTGTYDENGNYIPSAEEMAKYTEAQKAAWTAYFEASEYSKSIF
jgi:hypothetical protein